jgi:serine/threonine protein kinase
MALEVVMIVFPCARCGQQLQIPESVSGKPVRCSVCKNVMTNPVPVAVPVAALSALPEIAGQPSSLAQAGHEDGVTLGQVAPSDTDNPNKESSSHRALREALARGRAGGERYRVLNEIARGGMGSVLRAADCDIRREVAVKYLLDQADERKKARFIEEAQITGQLEHPNIVAIHELGIDAKKRLFFSMKMVRGRSLQQVFGELHDYPRSAEKEYTLTRLLGIFVNVCHALAYAHSRGVVHRDLKPANIMIGDFGEVYVMDWGLAKVLSRDAPTEKSSAVIQATATPMFTWAEEGDNSSGTVNTSRQAGDDQTVDGTILGTPLYMPPEQAIGNIAAIDQRSDIYSLGALLYEMLTLRPPVEKEGGYMAILMRVSQGEIVPPAQRVPERARAGKIPKELAAIAMKALAKEPIERYQDVADLRRDIELFLEGRSVSAKEDTKWESMLKFVRRNKGFSAAMAGAAAVLALVLIGSSWLNYKARVRAETAYAAYLQEQEAKRAQAKKSVPAFVEAAHFAAERKKFSNALAQVNIALEYDPNYAPARLLKGQLLIAQKDFAAARQELQRYLRLQPSDAQAQNLARLCARGRVDDPALNAELADNLIRQQMSALAVGLLQAPEKLRDVHRLKIEKAWRGLGQCLNMDADGQLSLNLANCPQVLDLLPLKDMPLHELIINNSQIRDLAPLQGMPLTRLSLENCPRVTDLTPLKGMKLTYLSVKGWGGTSDISVLKGMPLTKLIFTSGRFHSPDLRFLRDAPLTELTLLSCDEITNLAALKGKQLTNLLLDNCPKLHDLTAIRGMPLTQLFLVNCGSIADLKPLQGMMLTNLNLQGCSQIKDLTPLRSMPLTLVNLSGCARIEDLTPLAGMRLNYLNLNGCTEVEDLTPLKDMPLSELHLQDCRHVKDLKPLRGLSLYSLSLKGCNQITNLTPLEGMKLGAIWFEPKTVKTGVDILRKMNRLTKINDLPADTFWKQYDAGAFTK